MAPRKRNKRMDSAIDAMRPFGFEDSLIRQRVRQLLKVYGGDDYWLFVEENCYKVLFENLLEANAKEGEDSDEEGEEGTHLQNNSQEQKTPPASVCSTLIEVADSEPIGSDVVQALSESVMPEVEENVAPPESCSPPARNSGCDPPAEGNGNSLKDNILYHSSNVEASLAVGDDAGFAQTHNLAGQIHVASPLPTTSVSVQIANDLATSRACFGWIDLESDGDEDEGMLDFTCLTPAVIQTPAPLLLSEHSGGGRNKRVRQSRWDSKPGDP